MLAELRHAGAQRPAALAVGKDRKGGVTVGGSLSFDELLVVNGGLRRRRAKIDRDVVCLQQRDPFGGGPLLHRSGKFPRQSVAVRAALLIARVSVVLEAGDGLPEVLPEVLFQDAQRKAPAVRALEDVVHREDVRARIDLRLQAVAHRGPEEARLEEGYIEVFSFS